MKEFAVNMMDKLATPLLDHLLSESGQEDLCFATYLPSKGDVRTTAVIQEIIFPLEGERQRHTNTSFSPAYLERALEVAGKTQTGLVFIHSHLGPGWQGMSSIDITAEERIAPRASAVTSLPLLGMTAGTDGAWSARFWLKDEKVRKKYHRYWCESVKVIGHQFSITFCDELIKARIDSLTQVRTISAWGRERQQDLSRLRIAIVGLGSVGSMVAEILARIGITRFVLIDFDRVELKNLDRLTNVFRDDVGKPKVAVISSAIRRSSSVTDVDIHTIEYSICEEKGLTAALDCDIAFSCVDRPWPRQVLNFMSFAHLIPVVDGGILVRTNKENTKMKGADWRSHLVSPAHMCLECIGQYSQTNAKLEKDGYFDDPSYMKDWEGATADIHENVFAFSSHLASSLVLHFLSYFIAPSGISNVGHQMYHFLTGRIDTNLDMACRAGCYFPSIISRTHYSGVQVTAEHSLASKMRKGNDHV